MVDTAAVNTVTAGANANVGSSTDPAFNRSSQTRFQQALDNSVLADAQNANTDAAQQVTQCERNGEGQCIGDKMLDNIQKIKSSYDDTVNAINESVSGIEITPQGLLKLQMDIAKLQLQEELMAKTASKSTQNVDTLLKSQ